MNAKQNIEDELLVLQCQEGDVAAFEELLSRWQDRLWRHILRLIGEEDAAWDVFQDTWIAISRSIRSLRNVAAFRAWAYKTASNRCCDWIRKESRRRKTLKGYFEETQIHEGEWPEPTEPAHNLDEAVKQLSGNDRSILSLRYEEEFSMAAIAEILSIPEGTVKSRLFHAKKRLKKVLEEKNNE